ncbi:LysM-domain GPI-anchored protein 2 precursor [Tripterygium wilfordii]|uniref:LysM-domain GPI-anchored protein 2 n=1 Tax=Tripterygium wilfordii TaxID=458696 RepID=A0A7J7DHH8_TRIWF|nr:lysM domain-containing GPI-anchored protein 2 isoform X2 [Tripterygium wilfordii]KAF5745802.1 LysM-domain GPI-anchored protein 2 precursor [Tripterygium wilfordii]
MGFGSSMLLTFLFIAILATTGKTNDQNFKCTAGTTCQAIVGYMSPNTTTLASIQSLFNVRHLRSILGANNLPPTTSRNYKVNEQQTIKIPLPCICFNGSSVSNKIPMYTVRPDDGLYYIAAYMYSNLVQYPEIKAVNNLRNEDLILVGQELWIPVPCGCGEVEGERVVHYGHVVEEGTTVEAIADKFGTSEDTLLRLNGISDDSQLIAGHVIDVPVKACNSSIRTDSLDYPLLVSNGTYVHTANNCIMCKCDAANNWTLQCEPSQVRPSNWDSCPTMQCEGNLYIGNTTSNGCSRSSCAYAGYSTANQTIFTTLLTESTCASPPAPGNYASKMQLSWNLIFIPFHLIMLFQYLSL